MLFDKSKNKEKAAILKKSVLYSHQNIRPMHNILQNCNTIRSNTMSNMKLFKHMKIIFGKTSWVLICSYLCVTLKTVVPQQGLTLTLILVRKFVMRQ